MNWRRRSIGAALCLSPVFLLLASVGFGLGHPRPFWSARIGFMIAALLVAALNFYTSHILPRVYLWRNGSLDGWHYVSPIPLVTEILVVIGGFIGFGEIGNALLGMACIALDPGTSVWFLIWTWHDKSLWDSRRRPESSITGADQPSDED